MDPDLVRDKSFMQSTWSPRDEVLVRVSHVGRDPVTKSAGVPDLVFIRDSHQVWFRDSSYLSLVCLKFTLRAMWTVHALKIQYTSISFHPRGDSEYCTFLSKEF